MRVFIFSSTSSSCAGHLFRIVAIGVLATLLFISFGESVAENGNTFSEKKIEFESKGRDRSDTIFGYLSKPRGQENLSAAILLHGCTGLDLNGHQVAWHGLVQHARFLNKHNFVTLIVDSHGSRGIGTSRSWRDSCVNGEGFWERTDDVYGAVKYLQHKEYINPNQIVLLGQSQGAMVVFNSLNSDQAHPQRPIAAGVAYYPYCGYPKQPNSFYAPIIIITGAKDNITPSRYCDSFVEYIKENEKEKHLVPSILKYKNAHHSFDLPLERLHRTPIGTVAPNTYATLDSRDKYVEFLDLVLSNKQK